MHLHAFFTHSEIRCLGVGPTAGVVILNAIMLTLCGFVGVSAENHVGAPVARQIQGPG
jgi:hypothetical protein